MDYFMSFILALVAASPAYAKILSDTKKAKNSDNNAIKEAVAALTKSELTRVMLLACRNGYKTIEEADNVKTLYEPYHHLGFNGTLDNLHKQYNNLEVRSIEEANKIA